MPNSVFIPVTDDKFGNRTLMPALDLSQDHLQVVCHRFFAPTGIVNFNGFHRYRVGKVDLAG